MADKKISALTAATTPLAGTEVLPIVQSGSTVKVAVSDLTAGRAASAASLAVTGSSAPANGVYLPAANAVGIAASSAEQVRVTAGALQMRSGTALYVYNATNDGLGLWYNPGAAGINQLTARVNGADRETIDGATGNITNHTGNWVQGTAAKGVNFTANTPAAGMTSQLLNWYEEGTWTPTIIGSSSAGVGTYTEQTGSYTRIGRQVTVTCVVTWTAHTGTGVLRVNGLPFTIKNDGVYAAFALEYGNLTVSANAIACIVTRPGQTYLQVDETVAGGAGQTGVTLDTAASLYFSVTYFV